MIGIPTTAGTGSEAQSYALISDAQTHVKMACGDPKAAFRIALLDPALTISQPRSITATSGFDAIAHAVETYVTTRRNAPLRSSSPAKRGDCWNATTNVVLAAPGQSGSARRDAAGLYFAGVAIENSMLGATHACANPLTAHYGTAHGAAIAMLLPSVVRWNGTVVGERYAELLKLSTAHASVSTVRAPLKSWPGDWNNSPTAGGLRQSLERRRACRSLISKCWPQRRLHNGPGPLIRDRLISPVRWRFTSGRFN